MKTGRPLPELADELRRQAGAKLDFLAPANALNVSSNGHTELTLAGQAFAVGEVAHGQLAEYAGVPKAFYDRLRADTEGLRDPSGDVPLFDALVNGLLKGKGEEPRLVRTLDGTARAFLSDGYSVDLDNWDVFLVAARAIEEAGLSPEHVVSAEVTERRLYLKVVSPRLEAVVKPANVLPGHGYLKEPQVVRAGFVLSNSETGLGSLSVQQVVFKLMCTNLWIREDAYRQRHVGRALRSDEFGVVYRDDTRLADAKARLLKVRDHVTDALDEMKFRETVARMQAAADTPLEGSVEKAVEATARKFGLSAREKEDVLRHLVAGADLSLWGISNSVTRVAADASSYDRATELEAVGGRIIGLPAADAREIARAG